MTPTPTQPMGNDQQARTPTGELIDQAKPNVEAKVDEKPGDKPGDKPKETIPESYTFSAGEDQHLDEAAIGEVTPIFKELGLDQAGVDKLTGFYNKKVGELMTRGVEAVNTMREGWRDTIAKDPEIGGKLDVVKAEIGKIYQHLPPALGQEFRDAMNLTGAGDHPAFVKALYKLATLVNEGKPVTPGGPSPHGQGKTGAPQSLASAMYPNLPSR